MVDWSKIRQKLLGNQSKALLPAQVKLPILPLALMKFAKKADDPNASASELGQLIEADSGLTGELLRYVNSAAIGLRQKASSAQQAIATLGIRTSKLFLLSAGVRRATKGQESRLMNMQNFAIANLEKGLLAREVAKLLKADSDLAFAAAIMQDCLLPVLTNELFPTYLKFANGEDPNLAEITKFERQHFRWDHAEAAAQVMFGWGFPDDLVCCVYLHHRGLRLLPDPELGKTAAAAVAVSALIPDAIRQLPDGLEQLLRLDAAWPAFHLKETAKRVDEQFREMSPGLVNPFSLHRLCQKAVAHAG